MSRRDRQLAGQNVLVIGGSSGIGLETARQAHAEGAQVIVTAREAERVQRAGLEVGGSIAAFDATDFERLARFFDELRRPIDHVLVSGPCPDDLALTELDAQQARRDLEAHLLLPLQVAQHSATRVRPGGSVAFVGCTDGRRAVDGPPFVAAITAALSVMARRLAVELAPIRVNVIAAGFVDTLGSATRLGDRLGERRDQLEAVVPIRGVVDQADVAALAIHVMTNDAVTGATFEVDGGQDIIEC
jgi:NAD(P)-dependent dehydrogenase (short-subunit alcohol dehydrogenase family)